MSKDNNSQPQAAERLIDQHEGSGSPSLDALKRTIENTGRYMSHQVAGMRDKLASKSSPESGNDMNDEFQSTSADCEIASDDGGNTQGVASVSVIP